LSGSREDASAYFDSLTGAGVAVVAIDYRLAPSATYPSALIDVCDALLFLRDNADRLGLDPTRLVLAGDSAGAQIVSQIATQITSADYAKLLGRPAPIPPQWLRGVVLHCGFYDLVTFAERGRLAPVPFLRWGVGTMLWAYTGRRHPDPALLDEMSAMTHATAGFPRTFISGGNADPLTDSHSRPFANHLADMGVSVDSIFFDADHDPALGHEYQFDLDCRDGQEVLGRTIQFLVTATN
jgi:acetyl esterase/lipase